MHRNIYGLHAPMRQLMERKIVSYVGPYPSFEATRMKLYYPEPTHAWHASIQHPP